MHVHSMTDSISEETVAWTRRTVVINERTRSRFLQAEYSCIWTPSRHLPHCRLSNDTMCEYRGIAEGEYWGLGLGKPCLA
jgi:hypothetical protein